MIIFSPIHIGTVRQSFTMVGGVGGGGGRLWSLAGIQYVIENFVFFGFSIFRRTGFSR